MNAVAYRSKRLRRAHRPATKLHNMTQRKWQVGPISQWQASRCAGH